MSSLTHPTPWLFLRRLPRRMVALLIFGCSFSFALTQSAYADEISPRSNSPVAHSDDVSVLRGSTNEAPGSTGDASAYLSAVLSDLGAGPAPLAPTAPEAAAGTSVAAGGQPQVARDVQGALRSVQDNYLGPCIKHHHATCRQNMVELLDFLKGQRQTVSTWSLFEPIRNNMYFYLLAPSFRLMAAIVGSGGACGDWQSLAASVGMSLSGLLRDAGQEIGGRSTLPEFTELNGLRARLNLCPGTADDD